LAAAKAAATSSIPNDLVTAIPSPKDIEAFLIASVNENKVPALLIVGLFFCVLLVCCLVS
jgi:hypothetical protein